MDIQNQSGVRGRGRAANTVRKCSATFNQPLRNPSNNSFDDSGCGGAVFSGDTVEGGNALSVVRRIRYL